MEGFAKRVPAVLLLGPTGSGKSPLGDALEERTGRVHFDFGRHLRAIAAGGDDLGLSPAERAVVQGVIETGALFPDETLPLVAKIVAAVLARRPAAAGLVLNGLPRSISQAEHLASWVDVRTVIVFECPPEIALERVRRRVAGLSRDHAGRSDDTPGAVRRRLAIFEERSRPLAEHYRVRGADVVTVPVSVDTLADELATRLAARIG